MEEYFKNSLTTIKNINYIELIIKPKNNTENDINWTKEEFDKLILFLIQNNYSHFKKEYDSYVYQNLEYHIYDINEKPMVYKYDLLDHHQANNLIYHAFAKNNIPIHMFPSTMNIHEKNSVNRITIKINNRIYLNFEIKRKNIDYYKVYLNYNHSSNVDIDNNIAKIKEILDLILSNI